MGYCISERPGKKQMAHLNGEREVSFRKGLYVLMGRELRKTNKNVRAPQH